MTRALNLFVFSTKVAYPSSTQGLYHWFARLTPLERLCGIKVGMTIPTMLHYYEFQIRELELIYIFFYYQKLYVLNLVIFVCWGECIFCVLPLPVLSQRGAWIKFALKIGGGSCNIFKIYHVSEAKIFLCHNLAVSHIKT